MTRITTLKLTTIALLIASTAAASAYERPREGRPHADRLYSEIQAERERQRAAIVVGREDGSLTWTERFALDREQARIDALERDVLADGRLSRDEYRIVRQAQDDAARHIHVERHDTQVRGWWWRLWR